LPLLAFVFLAKVVEAFDYGVGVITFWFMIAFIILAGFIWFIQAMVAFRLAGENSERAQLPAN
jgi:hypothetical protein